MDQPKIERLLRLMKMLTANSSYTVDALAERLSMSRRTIYRYIDTFRDAGFVIKRDGEYIRLDKESPHFRDISQLVHFTEEESIILRRAIESVDDTNMLKADLKKKLYSVYDNKVLSSKISGKHAKNVHTLLEAISSKRAAVLCDYESANSGVVRNRLVEPFEFTPNYVQLWCYDIEDQRCKLFKTSRIGRVELGGNWSAETKHQRAFVDAFRMTGERARTIILEMGILARNLLIEEYPLAERDLTRMEGEKERWQLKTEVANFIGVGRFVVGLIDDIKIIESEELREHLRKYIDQLKKI